MSKLFKWFNKDKPSTPNSDESVNENSVADEDNYKQPDVQNESEVAPANSEGTESVDAPSASMTEQSNVPEEAPPVLEEQIEQKSVANDQQAESAPIEQEQTKPSFFNRLKASLSRTKANIGSGLSTLFKGKAIDDDLYEELETQLLVADVGMDTTQSIIQQLTERVKRGQLKDGDALFAELKILMNELLAPVNQPLADKLAAHDKQQGPFVILMVGVNGVGKTTTIGKMAKQFQQNGLKVMLAAGDTFRAAAVEQLQVWGERNSIPVVAQHTGADSASVLYDALEAAKARNIDVLLADTAGRLQNKDNLMEELKKVVRVMKKVTPDAPHEIMLTLDAGTGQNAISQASLFNEAVGLTGITLTKLDGTAKGGVIFAVADKLKVPIRYIGVGEGIDDLQTFSSDDFIHALFSDSSHDV